MDDRPLRLPVQLEPLRDAFGKALAAPLFGAWPEDKAVAAAEQPAEIATVLIGKLHDHLLPARVGYVFRKQMKKADRVQLAKAKRVPPVWEFVAELDFLVVFNWEAWWTLAPHQKLALVDHELCHCVRDPERDRWAMAHHDVEEFGQIVRRWGRWKPDLGEFADALAAQVELFPAVALTPST